MDILIDGQKLISVNSAQPNHRSEESTVIGYLAQNRMYSDKVQIETVYLGLPFGQFLAAVEVAQRAGRIPDLTSNGIAAFKKSLEPVKSQTPKSARNEFRT